MSEKNFIKPLPKNVDVAIDESLLVLQLRVRKGSGWEKRLRALIKPHLSATTQEEG